MDIRLYNELVEKSKDYTHLIIETEFKSVILQNIFSTVEEYLQAAL